MKKQKNLYKRIHVIRWLLSFALQYWKLFLGVIGANAVIVLCQLWIPQYFNFIFKLSIESVVYHLLNISMLVAAIMIIIFKRVQNFAQRNMQERIARDIQISMFEQVQRLEIPYFESHNVGNTLSSLTAEVDAIQGIYKEVLPKMISCGFSFVFSIVLMWMISWKLTMIYMLSFCCYYVIWPLVEKRRTLLTQDMQYKREKMNEKIYSSMSALLEVKAYGCQEWEIKRFEKKIEAFNKSLVKAVFSGNILESVRELIMRMCVIIIFIFSYKNILEGTLQVGELTTFLIYFFLNIESLSLIITQTTESYFILNQAIKLYEFLNISPEINNSSKKKISETFKVNEVVKNRQQSEEIVFQDVNFSYGDKKIIEEFNMNIGKGQHVAFVGRTGCGKTTLLKMIPRFYDTTKGMIYVKGIPIKEWDKYELRSEIGYLFQENFIFALNVMENIRFGKENASDQKVIEAAKKAHIHDDIMRLPQGYHTFLGERGSMLSGGQRQRIALARLFLKNPSIIILDEATSALDFETEKEIVDVIKEAFANKTVIAVAHRIASIRDYDRIVYLEDGKIMEEGTYEHLMERKSYFYRLVTANEGGV